MSWEDILFNNKNKEYGAYKLRKLYNKTLTLSLITSILIIMLFVLIPFIISLKKQYSDNFLIKTKIIAAELMPMENIKLLEEEKLKPQLRKEVVINVPKPDEKASNPKDSNQNNADKSDTLQNKTSDKFKANEGTGDENIEGDFLFTCGGDLSTFRHWFEDNFRYPKQLKLKGINDKIILQFCVNKKGYVDSIKILKGVDPLLDNEAKRVMMISPRWRPCIYFGRSVTFLYLFPIFITR